MSNIPKPTITRLQVRNYRSIASIDLTLEPLTVLVGSNGAGKSNLIDVIRFVRDALTRGLETAFLTRGGINAVRRWTPSGDVTELEITLTIQGPEWQGEYGIGLAVTAEGGHQVRWERARVEHPEQAADDRMASFEINEGQLIQYRVPSSDEVVGMRFPLPAVNDTSLWLPLATGWFEMYRLHTFLTDAAFYTIDPALLRIPQKQANPTLLDDHGANLASVLHAAEQRGFGDEHPINVGLRHTIPGVERVAVLPVGSHLITTLHHAPSDPNTQGPVFDLAQESDGTLRVLGILTALYQYPPRSLIVIEEPELNLHVGALGALCDAFHESSMRQQVVITTHSPDIITHFPVEALRVVAQRNGVTEAGPVAAHQYSAIQEQLFFPGELLRIEGLHLQEP